MSATGLVPVETRSFQDLVARCFATTVLAAVERCFPQKDRMVVRRVVVIASILKLAVGRETFGAVKPRKQRSTGINPIIPKFGCSFLFDSHGGRVGEQGFIVFSGLLVSQMRFRHVYVS